MLWFSLGPQLRAGRRSGPACSSRSRWRFGAVRRLDLAPRRRDEPRARIAAFVGRWCSCVVTGATAYAVHGRQQLPRSGTTRPPTVPTSRTRRDGCLATGPRIVFRHTGIDRSYGLVAGGAARRPGRSARVHRRRLRPGRRDVGRDVSCLHTERGVVTRYSAAELDADLARGQHRASLPGIPSRTRLSPDGTPGGHHDVRQRALLHADGVLHRDRDPRRRRRRATATSSSSRWCSTARSVRAHRPQPVGRDLRSTTTTPSTPRSATGGETYLVTRRPARRARSPPLADHVECPSLSPDGTRIAFKQADERDGHALVALAVLDLATGKRDACSPARRHSVDDQSSGSTTTRCSTACPATERARRHRRVGAGHHGRRPRPGC